MEKEGRHIQKGDIVEIQMIIFCILRSTQEKTSEITYIYYNAH